MADGQLTFRSCIFFPWCVLTLFCTLMVLPQRIKTGHIKLNDNHQLARSQPSRSSTPILGHQSQVRALESSPVPFLWGWHWLADYHFPGYQPLVQSEEILICVGWLKCSWVYPPGVTSLARRRKQIHQLHLKALMVLFFPSLANLCHSLLKDDHNRIFR